MGLTAKTGPTRESPDVIARLDRAIKDARSVFMTLEKGPDGGQHFHRCPGPSAATRIARSVADDYSLEDRERHCRPAERGTAR